MLALIFVAAMVVGAVTGRISLKSCCAVSDASRDLRMRAAFEDDPAEP